MIKFKRTVEQHHRVFTSFEKQDVQRLLLERAAELHGLDLGRLEAAQVRGEVPLTREEVLEGLGLSPVEGGTDGVEVVSEVLDVHPARVVSAADLEWAVKFLSEISTYLSRGSLVTYEDVELVIVRLGGRRQHDPAT